jgi:histidine ammonia-lyase
MNALKLNGNDLTLNDLREVVYQRRPVLLEPHARILVERAWALSDESIAGEGNIDALASKTGKPADPPLPESETRALMLLRANSLAKGYSGVPPAVIDTLCEMLNRAVHPLILSPGLAEPSREMEPLAQLVLTMIGQGEAVLEGKRLTASEAFRQAGIAPLETESIKTASLANNGAQALLATGTLALLAADTLVDSADVIAALALDALQGTEAAFDERIHKARPHAGQIRTAANLRRMLEGENEIRKSRQEHGKVRNAYSLCCVPQVHGAVRDTLEHCRQVLEIEMNSAVDDPLIFPAPKQVGAPQTPGGQPVQGEIIFGGNLHRQPLAFVLDFLAIALAALAGISQRRIEQMVQPKEGSPVFAASEAGLNFGLMMVQTAAALVCENQTLAIPASVDSMPENGNKEDQVPTQAAAANKLRKVVDNTRAILALEALTAAQALDSLLPLRTSKRGQQAQTLIRTVAARVENGRVLATDIERVSALIAEEKLAAILW